MAKLEAWQEVPFRDFIGQALKPGDFMAVPYRERNLTKLNILYLEGYQENGGAIIRELNRITGNWIRVYPKTNYNIIKISVEGVDVTKHLPVITLRAKEKVKKPNAD